MNEINFNITNNPWINNGLARLIYEFEINEEYKVKIHRTPVSVDFYSENDILEYISKIFLKLTSNGTYNFSQEIKKINLEIDNVNIKPSIDFPKTKDDCKKKVEVPSKKGTKKVQEWKQRLNFSSDSRTYCSFLDFSSTKLFNSWVNEKKYNKICMNCGEYSDTLKDSKSSINPLNGEHHNNLDEGVDVSKGGRKKIKLCKKCLLLAYISLFDKYIPFYSQNKKTFSILPNVNNLDILYKIENNLTNPTQYINFRNPEVIKYNTNIKEFHSNNSYLAILTVLHNIKNKYSTQVTLEKNPFLDFEEDELIEINDWMIFEKDSYSFYRIRSNNQVYKILEAFEYENEKKYLLTDFLNKIYIQNEVLANDFYESILSLDYKKFSNVLFVMSKNYNNIGGISNFYLFNKLFLDKILGVMFMLDETTKDSCKEIAKEIGKVFSKDIGLISKFAYVTNADDFKKILSETTFLMAKRSILDSDNPYLNSITLEKFLNQIDTVNFEELKSYFISFMSASVIYSNYKKTKD